MNWKEYLGSSLDFAAALLTEFRIFFIEEPTVTAFDFDDLLGSSGAQAAEMCL